MRDDIPAITEALGGIVESPGPPTLDTNSVALQQAAKSVLRITGSALAFGQSQSGCGFVVAAERVVTNAHVVSGVTEPVIETQGSVPRHCGSVVGVVFACSANSDSLGYAMTMAELNPVATRAAELHQSVDSGSCSRG